MAIDVSDDEEDDMKTILVPLDGSPFAEHGLRAAIRVATETGAALLLLRAGPFLDIGYGEDRHSLRTEIHAASAYLEEIQAGVAAKGVAVHTLLLPGEAVPAILFAAETEGVDLISMTTHGHGGLVDRLLGSVTAAVLQDADCPILITRAGASVREETGPMRSILVGLDGTPFAETGVSFLAKTGLGQEANILLAQAVEAGPPIPALGLAADKSLEQLTLDTRRITEWHIQSAESYIQATAFALLPQRHSRAVIAVGDPASLLIETARCEQVDLVVLTTHGRRGMDLLRHGSVAGTVLRHCEAPILILHGAEVVAGIPATTAG
jgi:nucleotide-binding universal stress UspA family protein